MNSSLNSTVLEPSSPTSIFASNFFLFAMAVLLMMSFQVGYAAKQIGIVFPHRRPIMIMLGYIFDICITAVIFFTFGYASSDSSLVKDDVKQLQYDGFEARQESRGIIRSFIGNRGFFLHYGTNSPIFFSSIACQFAIVCSMSIIAGDTVIGRIKLISTFCIKVVMVGLAYPSQFHWVYSPYGWLNRGLNDHYVQFKDAAGASTIHLCGGVFCLAGSAALFTQHRLKTHVNHHFSRRQADRSDFIGRNSVLPEETFSHGKGMYNWDESNYALTFVQKLSAVCGDRSPFLAFFPNLMVRETNNEIDAPYSLHKQQPIYESVFVLLGTIFIIFAFVLLNITGVCISTCVKYFNTDPYGINCLYQIFEGRSIYIFINTLASFVGAVGSYMLIISFSHRYKTEYLATEQTSHLDSLNAKPLSNKNEKHEKKKENLKLVAMNAEKQRELNFFTFYFNDMTQLRHMVASGIGGLVSASASIDIEYPSLAFLIGAVGGFIVYKWRQHITEYYHLLDPNDIIAIHLGCGIWSLIARAFVDPDLGILFKYNSSSFIFFLWQVVGTFSIIIWIGFLASISFNFLWSSGFLQIDFNVSDQKSDAYWFDMAHKDYQQLKFDQQRHKLQKAAYYDELNKFVRLAINNKDFRHILRKPFEPPTSKAQTEKLNRKIFLMLESAEENAECSINFNDNLLIDSLPISTNHLADNKYEDDDLNFLSDFLLENEEEHKDDYFPTDNSIFDIFSIDDTKEWETENILEAPNPANECDTYRSIKANWQRHFKEKVPRQVRIRNRHKTVLTSVEDFSDFFRKNYRTINVFDEHNWDILRRREKIMMKNYITKYNIKRMTVKDEEEEPIFYRTMLKEGGSDMALLQRDGKLNLSPERHFFLDLYFPDIQMMHLQFESWLILMKMKFAKYDQRFYERTLEVLQQLDKDRPLGNRQKIKTMSRLSENIPPHIKKYINSVLTSVIISEKTKKAKLKANTMRDTIISNYDIV
ncbi:hypothetical protein SNEBB_010969 [Seison nebaliae]|nr:hypothetical protein SNEBB_010969 [Seison nebaliae]